MKILICEENESIGDLASEWCRKAVEQTQARSIFVPAGRTPVELYKTWERDRPSYLNGLDLLQIDDVLSGDQKGVFARFFAEYLPSYQSQIRLISDGDAKADIAVLGLGLNGHVAFHEPGVDASFYSGCVKLNEITAQHLGLEPGTWGISYGAAAFNACQSILMIVSGASKQSIIRRLLEGDPALPASALLKHPAFTLLADRSALALFSEHDLEGARRGDKTKLRFDADANP